MVGDSLRIRRHHLPHWQIGGSTYFITFRSSRGALPDSALQILRSILLEGHGDRYELLFGVLMPDHVHLLLKPRERELRCWWDLAEIMKQIKGASSRRINQHLGTIGTLWQKESFDRIVRDEEEFLQKWEYMYWNPFKTGLVGDPEQYPYFIRPEA